MRLLLLPFVFATACAAPIVYTAEVDAGPDLVYAAPGVQVIADYDEPVFFVDGFYWRWDGAIWYRSPYWNRGWITAPPPPRIAGIQPRGYVHYRPPGYTPHQPGRRPVVRDHRPGPAPRPVVKPAPKKPVVRDHRD